MSRSGCWRDVLLARKAMTFNPEIHHRRSIRLQGYDYAQAGAYFVTICVQNRQCLFGEIVEGKMRLGAAGAMMQTVWDEIPVHYPGVDIAEFVVMPNHVHGIILVGSTHRGYSPPNDPVGAAPRGRPQSGAPQAGQPQGVAPTGVRRLSLSDVVHRYKTMTTKRYADGVKQWGWPAFSGRLWQRNYWEHVIRNDADFLRISEYIQNNPLQWEQDELNPSSGTTVGQP